MKTCIMKIMISDTSSAQLQLWYIDQILLQKEN
jgi:hypothetical protein